MRLKSIRNFGLVVAGGAALFLGVSHHLTTRRLNAIVEAGTQTMDAGSLCRVHIFEATQVKLNEALAQRDPEGAKRTLVSNLEINIFNRENHQAKLEEVLATLDPGSQHAGNFRANVAGDKATLKGLRESLAKLKAL